MKEDTKLNAAQMKNYIKGLQNPPLYAYTEQEVNQYQEFIKNNFGEYTFVYHELYSPDIHVDILVIPPNQEFNCYKLITRGMGAYKMNVPSQLKDYELERAELVIYLPSNWNMDFSKEENSWVVKLLKQFARLPIDEKSWIGFGHTLAHNDVESYASNTKLSSLILIDSIDNTGNSIDFSLPTKGKINFYQVLPLYKEELEYKMKYGTAKLLEKLSNASVVVDINRKNYCEEFNKNIEQDDLDIEK